MLAVALDLVLSCLAFSVFRPAVSLLILLKIFCLAAAEKKCLTMKEVWLINARNYIAKMVLILKWSSYQPFTVKNINWNWFFI